MLGEIPSKHTGIPVFPLFINIMIHSTPACLERKHSYVSILPRPLK